MKNKTYVEKELKIHNKKYKRGRNTLIIFNVMLFTFTALIAVFSLWTIKWADDSTIKWMFIIMSVISSVIVFATGFMILFNYNDRIRKLNSINKQLNVEMQLFNDGDSKYDGLSKKQREMVLVNSVVEILED